MEHPPSRTSNDEADLSEIVTETVAEPPAKRARNDGSEDGTETIDEDDEYLKRREAVRSQIDKVIGDMHRLDAEQRDRVLSKLLGALADEIPRPGGEERDVAKFALNSLLMHESDGTEYYELAEDFLEN